MTKETGLQCLSATGEVRHQGTRRQAYLGRLDLLGVVFGDIRLRLLLDLGLLDEEVLLLVVKTLGGGC